MALIRAGGPVDRCDVGLRVIGEEVAPDEITSLLGCPPTFSRVKGSPIHDGEGRVRGTARKGGWHLSLTFEEAGESDLGRLILRLLGRLTSDMTIWKDLGRRFQLDIFCGLFMESWNRGFSLSPEVCRQLAE